MSYGFTYYHAAIIITPKTKSKHLLLPINSPAESFPYIGLTKVGYKTVRVFFYEKNKFKWFLGACTLKNISNSCKNRIRQRVQFNRMKFNGNTINIRHLLMMPSKSGTKPQRPLKKPKAYTQPKRR